MFLNFLHRITKNPEPSKIQQPEGYYTAKEYAKLYNTNRWALYRAKDKGNVEFIRLGGRYFFKKDTLV